MAGNTAKKAGASDTELAKKGLPERFASAKLFGKRRRSGVSAPAAL